MDKSEGVWGIVSILSETTGSHQEGIEVLEEIISYLKSAALKSPIVSPSPNKMNRLRQLERAQAVDAGKTVRQS